MKVALPSKLNITPLLVAYTYFADSNYVGPFISNILELFRYNEIQLVFPYYLLSCQFNQHEVGLYQKLYPLAIFSWILQQFGKNYQTHGITMISSVLSHLFPTSESISYIVLDDSTLPILLTYIMTNLIYPTGDMNLRMSLASLRTYLSRTSLVSSHVTY